MKDFKLYLSVATILLIVYLVAQYNKPAPVNWQPTLYYKDKIPFGSYVLYKELPHIFPDAKIINTNQNLYNLFHNKGLTNSNYLILSKSVSLSKYDFKEMVSYIKSGNSVFIASAGWEGVLADTLNIRTGQEYEKKNVRLNFTNSKLKRANNYRFEKDISNEYFSRFDTAHAIVLGKNELGHSNFISFSYGKGHLFLCANPQLFTNFSLLNNQGDDYAAKALSYLPIQPNIYWDELQNGDIMEDPSPLRVFFSYPSLQWAYYISLFSLVIFVLYEMKRRQRIIPIIEPLRNSTVEFANVVGQVYYEQRNNMNIAQKKIIYFMEHVRTKYYLKTNPIDMDFIQRLSQKTGIEHSFIVKLVNHINYINVQKKITDDELILLNQLIEQFYNQSR
ncbi:DUF4350 domain-containing protein [Mucilaginibacter sp. McL0603]|uniref:DUF4350 domain-containing protein n=1 Tax=Mucilaginibacter sp. McL0603 TaxID=3415670 RepID=UPI003CF5C4FF